MATKKVRANGRAHILELRVRNVKCVREVVITPEGDITEIRGDTGEGKTTILESLEAAFRGMAPEMVRRGENRAEIELRLDQATINRIIYADGSPDTLMVKDANGRAVEKAKDFIRAIAGPNAFKPIEWVLLGGGEAKGRTERLRRQRDLLLEALDMQMDAETVVGSIETALGDEFVEALGEVDLDGVDFDQHPFLICAVLMKRCGDYRTLKNLTAETARNELSVTPAPSIPAPKEALEVLRAEMEAANAAYYRAEARTEGQQSLRARRDAQKEKIAAEAASLPDREKLEETTAAYQQKYGDAVKGENDLLEQIAALEVRAAEKRQEQREAREKLGRCEDLERAMDAQESRIADLETVERELASGGEVVDLDGWAATLERARMRVTARELQDRHNGAAAKAIVAQQTADRFQSLTDFFRDDLPKHLLAAAKLPVDGLSVDADQVLIHNLPLHQLGTSEQLRVAVQAWVQFNPRCGFIPIDRAESLGSRDRAALAELAQEMGLQLILTYVDADAVPGPGVVVMREGERVSAS